MYGRVKGGRVWHVLSVGRFTVGTVCGLTVVQTSDLPKAELCRVCWRIRERSFAHQYDSVRGQEPDEYGY